MNISVYLNDGEVISSVDINEATVEEALSAIKTFGFGENKDEEEWIYSDNQKIRYKVEDLDKIRIEALTENCERLKDALIDVQDECDHWKEMYKIECQHNDLIKTSYDSLTESFKELVKERDEYKEIASDRDDLKIENDKVKELCDMLQDEKDELQKRFNLVREDLFQVNHQVSELTEEKEKLTKENEELKTYNNRVNTALVGAKSTCATLEQDKFFWKNRWESEFKEGVRLKKELEKCQEKSES